MRYRAGAVAAAGAVIHVVVFNALQPSLGHSVGILAAIPILLVAWLGGWKWGVFYAVFLTGVVNPLLYQFLSASSALEHLFPEIVVAPINAAVVGYLRELRERSALELARRTRAEQARQASELRFGRLVDSLTKVVFETDANGNWTFLNPAWAEITGFPVETTLGRPFLDFVHAQDREEDLARFGLLMRGPGQSGRHEVRYRTADGGFRWIEVHARVLAGEHGECRGTTGTLTDVTELHSMQSRLAEATRRYEHVLALSPAVLYAVQLAEVPRFSFVSGNVTELLGCTPAQLLADFELLAANTHPDDLDRVRHGHDTLLAQGRLTREFRVRNAEGVYRWLRDAALVVRNDQGQPIEIVGSWTDATDIRTVEQQARDLAITRAARAEAEAGARRLQNTLESISDGFVSVDPRWRITYINGAACRFFDLDAGSVAGRPAWSVVPRALTAALSPELRRARADQRAREFEFREPHTGRSYETRVYPSTEGLSVFVRDVTERRELARRARRREKLQATLSRVSAEFAASIDVNLNDTLRALGEAVSVNRTYVFHLRDNGQTMDNTFEWCAEGTPPAIAELQGLPADMFPWWMAELRQRRPVVLNSLDDLPATERQTRETLEMQGVRSLLVVPIHSRGGELLGFMGYDDTVGPRSWDDEEIRILRVVSDLVATHLARREAEHALRRSEDYHRSLIENVAEIVAVLDRDGRVRYFSPYVERGLGRRPADLIGTPFADLVHGDDREQAELQLKRIAHGSPRSVARLAIRIADAASSWRDIEIVATNLLDVPAVQGIIINGRDVTERESLTRKFLQAQKMEAVGTLAGGVAHDFNNLLTAIGGYTEMLLLDAVDPEVRGNLEEIRLAARRAATLTQQLLAFSRKQVLQPVVVDLNEVVSNVTHMLARLIGEPISLSTVLDARTGRVRADPGQLQQVLMNLAVNARDAMPDGGRLTIETRNVDVDEDYLITSPDVLPGAYVRITVTDTGHGIDPESMPHIFEPFFTTKEIGKGTGLGLATAYGIVKQSGGWITVYSERGHGTAFKIYLPRVDAPTPAAATAPRPNLPQGSGRVLLVEDEATVRTLVASVLRKSGYTVIEAASGSDAIALVERGLSRPDLLVTDVVMPGLSGRMLAEWLHEQWPDLPVLFMSGYTDDTIVRHGVLDPDVHFIHKPFTPSSFARKVGDVLRATNALTG